MSAVKLFSVAGGCATELTGSIAALESDLQKQIEANMPIFIGVELLATEYVTGKTHKGRIDSLGLDENGCPVIIEYKRFKNENVINQGLFYLDWLLDHQAEFQLLVAEKLGADAAKSIEWSGTRLICIAADYTKFDEHAVQQIDRNIDLMRYRYFDPDLLLLELVNAQSASQQAKNNATTAQAIQQQKAGLEGGFTPKKASTDKTQEERLAILSPDLKTLFNDLCDYAEQIGDEVQRKDLKLYTAFKRIKNFLSIVVMPGKNDPKLQLYLRLPGNMAENNAFSRDVTSIGHWGTGDFEVTVRNLADLEKAKELIYASYEAN